MANQPHRTGGKRPAATASKHRKRQRGRAKPARSPTITSERAQDWISSVLNPMIDGLRRESRFLPAGPWRWLFETRAFEYFHPMKEYVAEIYLDNFDDFMAKHPKLKPEFHRHDVTLAELQDAVALAFDTLHASSQLRADLARFAAARRVDDLGQQYFLASLASGYQELPSSFSNYEVYNSFPFELRREAETLMSEPRSKACDAARRLDSFNKKLLESLQSLRTDIADRYGARIMPVLE